MTAPVLTVIPGGRNRAEVVEIERRHWDELRIEFAAITAERERAAAELAALARRARFVVLAGGSPVRVLAEIERLAEREQTRARAAA